MQRKETSRRKFFAATERTVLVSKSILPTLPPAFRERVMNAMEMYRNGATKKAVILEHGSIVADESIAELNRTCPKWWCSE